MVKTQEAGGRTFLFGAVPDKILYVSEGAGFRPLNSNEDPVVQVREYLNRAWLTTEQGRLSLM
jgi:hypothetical protein